MSTEVDALRKSKEQKVKKRRMEAKVTPAVDELRKEDKMMHKIDGLGEDPTSIKDRKKKRKRSGSEVDSGTVNATESGTELAENDDSKKNKKRKGTEAAGAEEPKREKTKKRSSNGEEDTAREGAASSDTRKVSREKKSDTESKKKSKKERIRDKTLPDPSDDASLSERSRGALSYAYARLSSPTPSSWKFNKAQQNWIVKHFFEYEEIPEKYIPIVAGYLAGSQGGVRENLVQACNKQLDQMVSEQVSDAKTGNEVTTAAPSEPIKKIEVSPEVQEALKPRARVLLKALGHASS